VLYTGIDKHTPHTPHALAHADLPSNTRLIVDIVHQPMTSPALPHHADFVTYPPTSNVTGSMPFHPTRHADNLRTPY